MAAEKKTLNLSINPLWDLIFNVGESKSVIILLFSKHTHLLLTLLFSMEVVDSQLLLTPYVQCEVVDSQKSSKKLHLHHVCFVKPLTHFR